MIRKSSGIFVLTLVVLAFVAAVGSIDNNRMIAGNNGVSDNEIVTDMDDMVKYDISIEAVKQDKVSGTLSGGETATSESVSEAPTEPVTEAPTEPATEPVTEAPTEPVTEVVTEPETAAPVNWKYVYVGDSRTKGLKAALEKYGRITGKETFICEIGEGYDFLMANMDNIRSVCDSSTVLIIGLGINDMKYRATQYESNISDLAKLKKKYTDISMLKKAYSTKSGIPLDHIKLYLTDTRQLANEMLNIVYDGDIQLEEFDLTENEFNIPFYNKGVVIPDIRYASQGESSFLSIAISFALSYQNLTDYNIPLLDEADSNLDSSNRMKFINVIEHFMDIINCEQLFIITHNDMFSQYPVDVIDFDNLKFNDSKLSTTIYKK